MSEKKVNVKGFSRRGIRVRPFQRRQKIARQTETGKKDNTLRNTAIGAAGVAAVIGIGTLAYKNQVKRYRSGFADSAKMAEDLAKQVNVGKVKNAQENIVFGVGGLSKVKSQQSGERIVLAAKKDFSPTKNGVKAVPIDSSKTNPLTLGTQDELLASAQYYKNIMKEGRNLTAVDLASQVIAYGDKFPDRQLVMMGFSSGGFAVHEAQEILRIARPDFEKRLKSVNFGTEHWGATKKFGESVTIGSKHDPFIRFLPTRDLKRFDDVKSHSFQDYGTNKQVQDFIKNFLKKRETNFSLQNIKKIEFSQKPKRTRKRTAAERAAISRGLREYYATQPKKQETKAETFRKVASGALKSAKAASTIVGAVGAGLTIAQQIRNLTYKPSRGERFMRGAERGAGLLSSLSNSYKSVGRGTSSLTKSANTIDDLRIGAKKTRFGHMTQRLAQEAEKIKISRDKGESYRTIANTSAKSNSPGGTKFEDMVTRRGKFEENTPGGREAIKRIRNQMTGRS